MLNMDQIRRYNLTPMPTKISDVRSPSYVKTFGDRAWELDALGRERMQKILEARIKELIDWKVWNEVESRNQRLRDELVYKKYELLRKLDELFKDL